jgi:chromosome segregation ATPase
MQKEASKLEEETKQLQEIMADLHAQVTEATEQLTKETEAKVNAEEEKSRISEALEACMEECYRLRGQLDEQAQELEEARDRVKCFEGWQAQLQDTNKENEVLATENAKLHWELTRCVFDSIKRHGEYAFVSHADLHMAL